jgi:hypothetical protein
VRVGKTIAVTSRVPLSPEGKTVARVMRRVGHEDVWESASQQLKTTRLWSAWIACWLTMTTFRHKQREPSEHLAKAVFAAHPKLSVRRL